LTHLPSFEESRADGYTNDKVNYASVIEYAALVFAQQQKENIAPPPRPISPSPLDNSVWLTKLQNKIKFSSSRSLLDFPVAPIQTPFYENLMKEEVERDRKVKEIVEKGSKKTLPIHALDALPELSQKDRDNYKRLMNMGPGEVCYSFKVHLQHSDIQTLKPGTWLNDEVINF
jgi:Ulp1 family protease